MSFVRLTLLSLQNRWLTALLAVLAIAVSVVLLLGVEKIRLGARASFANTISGTDLIVGARSGGIQLLLYSVFHSGTAANNVRWRSFEEISAHPDVDWIVPISLGDSHRGFRVVGTSSDYFRHFQYRRGQSLEFSDGVVFDDLFDAVIGADVARELGYTIGQRLVLDHGVGEILLTKHDKLPFKVSGILKKTGTPVDRSVLVSLEGIEALHLPMGRATGRRGVHSFGPDDVRKMTLKPSSVSAAFVGLKSRIATFKVQRYVNTYRREPLSAILPGVTLHELWGLVGTAESALMGISAMVVVTALLGMVTMILATLNERRREVAILRSVGAGPKTIVGLMVSEALVLTCLGVLIGVLVTYMGLFAIRPWIEDQFGLHMEILVPGLREVGALCAVVLGGAVAGLVPAWRAYRRSLSDGMSVRS